MAVIELTLTKDYVDTWAEWEGIRELVQNAIDGETEFGYKMKVQMSASGKLIIENQGGSLPRDALLFGYSTKRDRKDLLGQFGEGLKLGILALVRDGKCITIKNGGEIWKPVIEKSDKFDQDVLKFKIRKNTKKYNSLRVEVKGISSQKWNEYKKNFIFLNPKITGKVKTRYGMLIKDPSFAGDLYVDGIFVEHREDLQYGYNFTDRVSVDRDRQMVNSFDLSYGMATIINRALNNKKLSTKDVYRLLEDDAKDVEDLGNCLTAPSAEKISDAFLKKHGKECVPVLNDSESKIVSHLGKKGVRVPKALNKALAVTFGDFDRIQSELKTQAYKPAKNLTAEERNTVDTAVNMIAVVDPGVRTAQINIVEYKDKMMLGQWQDGLIRLARRAIQDLETCLSTLAHEWCHSFGSDGEKSFHHQLENLLAKVAIANMQKTVVAKTAPKSAPSIEDLAERRKLIVEALTAGNETVVDVTAYTGLNKKVVRRTLQSMAKKEKIYAERVTDYTGGRKREYYIYKTNGAHGETGIHGEWE